MDTKKILQYESYVFVGMLLVIGTFAKLVLDVKIDSDWFWFIAGLALVLEGFLLLSKQKQFNKKYKVISKHEFNELWGKLEEYEKKK